MSNNHEEFPNAKKPSLTDEQRAAIRWGTSAEGRLVAAGENYAKYKRSERFNRNVQRVALGIGAGALALLALDTATDVDTRVSTPVEIVAPLAAGYMALGGRMQAKGDRKMAQHELEVSMLVTSPRYAAGRGQNSDSAPPVPEWMLGAMDMEQRQRLSQDIAKYGNDAQKAQLPLAAPYTKE